MQHHYWLDKASDVFEQSVGIEDFKHTLYKRSDTTWEYGSGGN